MIEVRLRHVDTARAHHLMDVPVDRLDTVIPTLSSWGVTADGSDCSELYGQFVITDSDAYFEVVAE